MQGQLAIAFKWPEQIPLAAINFCNHHALGKTLGKGVSNVQWCRDAFHCRLLPSIRQAHFDMLVVLTSFRYLCRRMFSVVADSARQLVAERYGAPTERRQGISAA